MGVPDLSIAHCAAGLLTRRGKTKVIMDAVGQETHRAKWELRVNAETPDPEIATFERAIRQCCGFLESDQGFQFTGVREFNDGPRDRGLVAGYRQGEARIRIGWGALEGSLVVSVRLDADNLNRAERWVYLEPFVEFVSNGEVAPVVPQIYPGMSVRKIEKAITLREQLFQNGVGGALETLASRLREYYGVIRAAPPETIRQYHQWFQRAGRAASCRRNARQRRQG